MSHDWKGDMPGAEFGSDPVAQQLSEATNVWDNAEGMAAEGLRDGVSPDAVRDAGAIMRGVAALDAGSLEGRDAAGWQTEAHAAGTGTRNASAWAQAEQQAAQWMRDAPGRDMAATPEEAQLLRPNARTESGGRLTFPGGRPTWEPGAMDDPAPDPALMFEAADDTAHRNLQDFHNWQAGNDHMRQAAHQAQSDFQEGRATFVAAGLLDPQDGDDIDAMWEWHDTLSFDEQQAIEQAFEHGLQAWQSLGLIPRGPYDEDEDDYGE